jgi:hypothetical protein
MIWRHYAWVKDSDCFVVYFRLKLLWVMLWAHLLVALDVPHAVVYPSFEREASWKMCL